MGINLIDVANYCNVSSATVSMVVNGKTERISDATTQKVLEAVKVLGYVPNMAARSMMTRQTKTIGLIIPDISDYFFSELAKGIGDEADRMNYDLILGNTNGSLAKEQEYIRVFQGRLVDGIIFSPLNTGEENDQFAVLQAKKYPFVTIERYLAELEVPSVIMNNFQGAFDLATHMTSLGHRHIAFITGPMAAESSKQRLAGYKSALSNVHIPYDPSLVFEGNFFYESGVKAGEDFFSLGRTDVTAVLASNNTMALGFYEVAESRGYSIPKDLSLAGIGGARFCPVLRPKITTIDMPIYEIGKSAAQMLFKLIKGKPLKEKKKVFDLKLLEQGSVAQI
ncbi:MAG: LacI family DNA-binding transcriptional regulator [Sphaerochaeta sp.]|nr:LacI family DNA-binding transcriptional regulator [Sphaerochaeta sp.]